MIIMYTQKFSNNKNTQTLNISKSCMPFDLGFEYKKKL